jgi:death on curing protein
VTTPEFLTVEDVVFLHEQQLARYGGGAGLRDVGSLESAVATPKATFDGQFVHSDIFEMAAAYAFHIAQNQPFVDGNKRTGLAAALVFLDVNNTVVTDPDGRLYQAMLDLADHRLDKPRLALLLRSLASHTAD